MLVTLYHRGVAIGETTLGPLVDGQRSGKLSPTASYDAARPALQRLTLDAVTNSRSGEDVHREVMAGAAALAEEGLEIRDSNGAVVPSRFIMIGDYAPPGTDMAWLSNFMPIPIFVVF